MIKEVWYDNELFMIQAKLKTRQISQKEHDLALSELYQKLEGMWKGVNGELILISDCEYLTNGHVPIWSISASPCTQ